MKVERLKSRHLFTALALLIIASALAACSKPAVNGTASPAAAARDVVINTGDITKTAAFIPYEAGGVKMEIIVVKAPDGTIRTALNTCQVCYDSGRGYYVQMGDTLVCQNCGNKFKISQVEKEKNGCNPVPILDANKKDDGTTITISASFLEQNKGLFANWKTR